jgi:hypothetical protein
MLGAILVVVALVLAILSAFARHRNHAGSYWLLPISVILLCIALLVGVEALVSVKGD